MNEEREPVHFRAADALLMTHKSFWEEAGISSLENVDEDALRAAFLSTLELGMVLGLEYPRYSVELLAVGAEGVSFSAMAAGFIEAVPE